MGEPVESLISRALVAERADAEMRMRLPTDLIGPGQPLIDYVAGLVSRSEISSLERLYGERTPLHRILDDISGLSQYDEPATVFGAPFWEREKSVVHAARALAAMGLVLVGASENTDIYRMKAALAWYDMRCAVATGGLNGPPGSWRRPPETACSRARAWRLC